MQAPEYFVDGCFSAGNCYFDKKPTADSNVGNHHFTVDDLLDFSKADEVVMGEGNVFDNVKGNSAESSGVTAVDSCNSSVSGGEPQFSGGFADGHFSGELCVPLEISEAVFEFDCKELIESLNREDNHRNWKLS